VDTANVESTKDSMSLAAEDEPVEPPPPRKTVAKVKPYSVAPSTGASIPSSSNDHVSVFPLNGPHLAAPRADSWLWTNPNIG
jgi:hypothetical protein